MEQMKLAQYYSNVMSNTKKKEILKGVAVDYCIPNTLVGNQRTRDNWPGYTNLHFAADKLDLETIEDLLDQGADLFQQDTIDRSTPLHIAVNKSRCHDGNYLYSISGQLQEYKVINILLAEQVHLNNKSNPKDKFGVSHFHIACMVNNVQAVELFITAKEPLDQSIDDGPLCECTPLHCAIKYSSVEVLDILLQNGADIHIENGKGMSGVHLLIKRLMHLMKFITMGKHSPCTPIADEIDTIESMIKLILRKRASKEVFLDDTGLSAFHLACTLQDESVAQDFLKLGVNINMPVEDESKFWPGWTPLHFAACSNIGMMIFLIGNGADILIKNSKGETPLDLCASRFALSDIQSILLTKEEFREIVLSDNHTKLFDLLFAMDDYDRFEDFLEELEDVHVMIPNSSPIWPGYNLLHLSISLNEKTKLLDAIENLYNLPESKATDYLQLYNCTEKEEALYMKKIELCLEHDCGVDMKNVSGLTPIHLAFSMLEDATIITQLLLHSQDNQVDQNGLSHLHIACALGKKDIVKGYLNEANVNSRVKKNFQWYQIRNKETVTLQADSTPLHVAVACGHSNLFKYLVENDADIYAKDSLGLTPIHLLMSMDKFAAEKLLKAVPNLQESVSKANLSHLHVAAYFDNEEAVRKILLKGAEIERVVDANVKEHPFLAHLAGKTPLHVARINKSDKVVKALLEGGANVHAKDLEGISVLQYSIDDLDVVWTEPLIAMLKSGMCDVETSGITLLHFACGDCNVEWTKELLEQGADVNARISTDVESSQGATPLYIFITPASSMGVDPEDIVKLLLNYGADATIECYEPKYIGTPLHLIYKYAYPDLVLDDVEFDGGGDILEMLVIADLLLDSQKSYDVNPIDCRGFSHFHFACLRNREETVKKFLDHGVDLNGTTDPFASRIGGLTALHFALAYKSREVAYLLLERGADVNAEDTQGNTPIHVAVKRNFVDFPLIKTIISYGADITVKNLSEETPLHCLLRFGDLTLERLEFFLNHGGFINIFHTTDESHRGILGLAMMNVPQAECQLILERLSQVDEVKNAIQSGFNAIENIVAVDHNDKLTLENYLRAIQFLMSIGCEIDQQDTEGKTALHTAVTYFNFEAVCALIQLGADVNIIDRFGQNPLSHEAVFAATNPNDPRKMIVIKALAIHIWNMNRFGLDVNDLNLRLLKNIEKEMPFVESMKKFGREDWIKAKQTRICQSLTVKDFLSELGAVAQYPTMYLVQREIVDNFFKCSVDLRKEFPIFCGLLAFQYRKALARIKLFEPAKEAIVLICQMELPDLCSEAILRFFTNNEMQLVIEVANELFD